MQSNIFKAANVGQTFGFSFDASSKQSGGHKSTGANLLPEISTKETHGSVSGELKESVDKLSVSKSPHATAHVISTESRNPPPVYGAQSNNSCNKLTLGPGSSGLFGMKQTSVFVNPSQTKAPTSSSAGSTLKVK